MPPQASIIIPCYNIAPHLGKCIDSLLVQTFTDFELILVNDGSTDDTGAVCDLYAKKDQWIRVFHKENGGVSAARNLGIEKSVGELILFIDGDDYVKPDYIAQLVNGYADGVWPICGMINVRMGIEKENENYSELLRCYSKEKIGKENLLDILKYSSLSSPCARIYSKKIIQENYILFDKEITYQEDLVFNLLYVKHIDTIRAIPYFGYYYIEHEVSSTGRFHSNFNQIELLFKELIAYVQTDEDKFILQEFLLQTILRKIANCFHVGAPISNKEKFGVLQDTFLSAPYQYAYSYIGQLGINPLLKTILKWKRPELICFYFKILRRK